MLPVRRLSLLNILITNTSLRYFISHLHTFSSSIQYHPLTYGRPGVPNSEKIRRCAGRANCLLITIIELLKNKDIFSSDTKHSKQKFHQAVAARVYWSTSSCALHN